MRKPGKFPAGDRARSGSGSRLRCPEGFGDELSGADARAVSPAPEKVRVSIELR